MLCVMRLFLSIFILFISWSISAQNGNVTYLESTGNNGSTRVFSVTTPVNDVEVITADGKVKLKPEEQACRDVMNAILFDGVENYNDGQPIVTNPNDSFAKSLVNPKTKTFMTYFKEVEIENSPKNKSSFHYIVELNQFNLMRILKMRGSIK